ncbi:MAG TPA: hypothetical protein VNA11_11985 [Pseudonocardia sp.]|nr:hypothetical protein [Pseudonocardia sp.]
MAVDATDTRLVTLSPGVRRRFLRTLLTGAATPDRLRRVGAVLVLGCLLFALVSALSGVTRTDAVQDAGSRLAALNADAAQLYQALADADAMATSGFVAGGREPPAVRNRYDDDLARASDRLIQAAGRLPDGDPAQQPIMSISGRLAEYAGLIETARVYNRQGLPLGQSYLDSGSRLMRTEILPAAEQLRRLQTAALEVDYQRGGVIPFAALLVGVAVLAAVIDVAVVERRRTNRVLNLGLLGAGLAVTAAVLWWAVALLVAGSHLAEARQHSDAAAALDEARAAVLQARSTESLVLVARNGGSTSDADYFDQLRRVVGPDGSGGLLGAAATTVPAGRITEIRAATQAWQDAHRRLRLLDDGGNYRAAVASATGTDPAGSGVAFQRLDSTLGGVADTERRAFDDDLDAAGGVLTAISIGPAALAVLAAAAASAGIARRVGEYR